MKQNGIEICKEVLVTNDGVKRVTEALMEEECGGIPPDTTYLPEVSMTQPDGSV